jgi:superfamily II DNA or RNA helicase
MTLAIVVAATHHFVVSNASMGIRVACQEFSRGLTQFARTFTRNGRTIKSGEDKHYDAATESRNRVRYHINHLEAFKKLLYRHNLDAPGLIQWETAKPYLADHMHLVIRSHFIPSELQEEAIAYILSEDSPTTKAVILQAGGGKTLLTMMAAAKYRQRMCIMLEPKYIDQWLKAFDENCIIDKKRICVIGGDVKGGTTNALRSLLEMAEDGGHIPYDVIIVSTVTFRGYIEAYEACGNATKLKEEHGFVVPPYLFFQHLRIGFRVIDEVHENFNLMFRLDCYTHVNNAVSLSATLQSDDAFINNMMRIAYPPHQRFDKGGFNKYVQAYSLHYSVRRPQTIRTLQKGMAAYSHVEFEKSLMKSKEMLNAYFQMTRDSLIYTYDLDYRQGDRCLVYFATIEMCTLFTEYIEKHYKHLDVRRFVGEDPFENLVTADIIVSTLKSAGTGKDIPQLTTVIMTPAVNSSPTNIQGFGRLRDLNRKDPSLGRKMYFVYFVGDDFAKHHEYHQRKKELLATRALKYEPRYYGTMI